MFNRFPSSATCLQNTAIVSWQDSVAIRPESVSEWKKGKTFQDEVS